jgi:hypothetical protein
LLAENLSNSNDVVSLNIYIFSMGNVLGGKHTVSKREGGMDKP